MNRNQILLIVGGGCLLAFCAIAALLLAAFYIVPNFGNRLSPVTDIVTLESNPRPNANGNSMGDPNAPIQIIEFGDYQCPYCEQFHAETEPLLVESFIEKGIVYFTYRSAGNWVSTNSAGNTESQDAALAAYCAADQNQFWDMHDALFANNRNMENQGSFSSRRLTAIAESIDLDMKEFQDCYDNGKFSSEVQQDLEDALDAGIQGTPFFVLTYQVKGETKTKLIGGAQPIEIFEQTIEEILQDAE
jgi:protein-disulfide isomerase